MHSVTDRQITYDGNTALCTKVHRAVKTTAAIAYRPTVRIGLRVSVHNRLKRRVLHSIVKVWVIYLFYTKYNITAYF